MRENMLKYLSILLILASCAGNPKNEQYSPFPSTHADTLWMNFHNALISNDQEYLLCMSKDSIDCAICEQFAGHNYGHYKAQVIFDDSLCRKEFFQYSPKGEYFEFYNPYEDEERIVYDFRTDPGCKFECTQIIFYFEKNEGEILYTGCFHIP